MTGPGRLTGAWHSDVVLPDKWPGADPPASVPPRRAFGVLLEAVGIANGAARAVARQVHGVRLLVVEVVGIGLDAMECPQVDRNFGIR